jgi:hypothetical protein
MFSILPQKNQGKFNVPGMISNPGGKNQGSFMSPECYQIPGGKSLETGDILSNSTQKKIRESLMSPE